MARESEGQKQAEKTVDGGGERHGDTVRSGKAVGDYGGTEGAREKDTGVRDEEKRRPENRGADREMIFEMARAGSKVRSGLVILVQALAPETFVGMAVVFGEIEIVLDERSTSVSVIANAIAAHPRVQKRKRA